MSPFFKKNEDAINDLIDNVKSAASKAQEAAMDKAKEAGSAENIMKGMAMAKDAQAKLEGEGA